MSSEKEQAMRERSTAQAAAPTSNLRLAQFTRAGVLLAVGLATAFTATLHRYYEFDRWLLVVGLGLIGIATLVEYFALRDTTESGWVAARATVAIAAAGSLLAAGDTPTLALIIALWAGLTALITLMRLVRKVQPVKVALPSLALSVLLAVAALIARQDPIALVGVFGAYAIIRGVFLGIVAFDPRPPASESTPETTDSSRS